MALWYFTRASGAVSLVLLTLTLVLGVVDVSRWFSPRFPRFLVDGIHRTRQPAGGRCSWRCT